MGVGWVLSKLDRAVLWPLARLSDEEESRKAFAERAGRWTERLKEPRPPTNPESLDLVLDALNGQLDRANSSIKSLDDKASLVVPAVGAVASLVGVT